MGDTQARSFFSHKMAKWGLFIVFLFAFWFVGWFVVARFADQKVVEQFKAIEERGLILSCDNRSIQGFPFRLGLFCDKVSLASKRDAFRFEGGAFRSAAQIYAPSKMIVEMDGPLVSWPQGVKTVANWQEMRLFAHMNLSEEGALNSDTSKLGFQELALNFSELDVSSKKMTLKVDVGGLYARPTPKAEESKNTRLDDLDFAGQFDKVLAAFPQDNGASFDFPAANFVFDVSLKEGYQNLIRKGQPLRQVLQGGGEALIRYAAFIVPNGGQLAVSGPLIVHDDGTLSGTIYVGLANTRAVVAWLEKAVPQLAPFALNLEQAVNGMGEMHKFGEQELRAVALDLDYGKVKFGFIRVGKIPPLF